MQPAKSILIGITALMLVLASEICGQTCLKVFYPNQIEKEMATDMSHSSNHGSDASQESNHCDTTEPDTRSSDHCDGSDCEAGCEMWVKSDDSIALSIDIIAAERNLSEPVILFTTEDTKHPHWFTPPPLQPHSAPLYLRNGTLLI